MNEYEKQISSIDYLTENFINLKKKCRNILIITNKFDSAFHLSRAKLIDEIISIHEKMKMKELTLFLTIKYFDFFVIEKNPKAFNERSIMLTCLYIAAKINEINVIEIRDLPFNFLEFPTRKILKLEENIVDCLNYQLNLPTLYDFLSLYLKQIPLNSEEFKKSILTIELLLFDINISNTIHLDLISLSSIFSFYSKDSIENQFEKLSYPHSFTSKHLIQCINLVKKTINNLYDNPNYLRLAKSKYINLNLS